jgi:broad specificity phosphatase PhoE
MANHQITLTPRGHEQATTAGHRLVEMLKADDNILFYTSPYKRTRQTTEDILNVLDDNRVPYKVHEEPRIREQDFGNFQGESQEMERIWEDRAHYGHFFYRIPHGESAADVYDRCATFNETLFRQFSSDKFPSILVLVTHGIWARVFLMKWYRWTYEEFESLQNIPHCQFIIMERGPDTHKFTLKTKMRTWTHHDEDGGLNDVALDKHDKNSIAYEEELQRLRQKEDMIRGKFIQAQRAGVAQQHYIEQTVLPELTPSLSSDSRLEQIKRNGLNDSENSLYNHVNVLGQDG